MARDLHRQAGRHEEDAIRITTAASNRNDEIAARQRRYIFSMLLRTVCFVGAIVVGPGWLRWVLVAGAVVLPYVAVVMANAALNKDDGFDLPGGRFAHELDPGTAPGVAAAEPSGEQPGAQPGADDTGDQNSPGA